MNMLHLNNLLHIALHTLKIGFHNLPGFSNREPFSTFLSQFFNTDI